MMGLVRTTCAVDSLVCKYIILCMLDLYNTNLRSHGFLDSEEDFPLSVDSVIPSIHPALAMWKAYVDIDTPNEKSALHAWKIEVN